MSRTTMMAWAEPSASPPRSPLGSPGIDAVTDNGERVGPGVWSVTGTGEQSRRRRRRELILPEQARLGRRELQQRSPHLPDVRITIAGRVTHRPGDDALKSFGQIGAMGDRRFVVALHDRLEYRGEAGALVGQPSRHTLVQDDAERVLIAGRADRLGIFHLLGREVARRAQDRARCPDAGERCQGRRLGDPEVEHLRMNRSVAHLRQEDVWRFEVAMDDPLVMRGGDRRQDRKRDVHDLVERQRATVAAGAWRDPPRRGTP